jgi:hypothetical protein
MTLRFYRGGPRAVTDHYVWRAQGWHPDFDARLEVLFWGCDVARRSGVFLPKGTYDEWLTALLPLEE